MNSIPGTTYSEYPQMCTLPYVYVHSSVCTIATTFSVKPHGENTSRVGPVLGTQVPGKDTQHLGSIILVYILMEFCYPSHFRCKQRKLLKYMLTHIRPICIFDPQHNNFGLHDYLSCHSLTKSDGKAELGWSLESRSPEKRTLDT